MPKSSAQTETTKPTSGDETRQRLTAATAALIAERGWDAATTRLVAERAGVNQALVHYHFGSVENLRREAVMVRLEPEVRSLLDEVLHERPMPESIHRVLARLDRFDLTNEVGVLMAEVILRATRDPVVSEAMGEFVGTWVELLEPRLQLAQERGVVRSDVDALALGRIIGAVIDGFLFQRMADPSMDPTQVADTLIQLLSPPRGETP